MTRIQKLLIPLLTLLLALTGVAGAQPIDLSPVLADPVGWAVAMTTNPLLLGLFVFGTVATVKRDAERRKPPISWNPWLWRGIAFMVGVVSSVLLRFVVVRVLARAGVTLDVGVTLLNGFAAGVIAVIGRDGLKTTLGWLGRSDLIEQLLGRSGPEAAPAATQSLFGAALPVSGAGQPLFGAAQPLATPSAGTLSDLIGEVLHVAGVDVTRERLTRVLVALAPVAPDLLLDGSPYLKAENRSRVLQVVMSLKSGGEL